MGGVFRRTLYNSHMEMVENLIGDKMVIDNVHLSLRLLPMTFLKSLDGVVGLSVIETCYM